MSYSIIHHRDEDGKHWCRLDRENGLHTEHVLSARFTAQELLAFIHMVKKLDPSTRVEEMPQG